MAIKDLIPWKKPEHRLARREDPFELFRREMEQVFDGLGSGRPAGSTSLLERQLGAFTPNIDVSETDQEVRVTAELPGLEEKDVEVTLVDGALSIKGEKRDEQEEEKGEFYRSERRYGMFERRIALPAGVDPDKAAASFKKGVLRVTLPKTAEAQNRRRRVPVMD